MVNKRKTIARITALATAAALSAAALAGCSSSSSSDTTDKKLTIGMNSGLVAQFQRYVKAFEKTHKGWTITVKAVPDQQADYIQQLTTEGLSKTLPDITFNYDTLNQTLVANHLLYNIKPWLDSGKDGLKGSAFLPNFLAQYKVGDQITGIPVSADTGVWFYNKTLFEKYGVTEPKAGWTYDDMYKDAQTITSKSGGSVFGTVTPMGDSSAYFTYYPVLRAYGSNIYDAKTKKFIFANADGIKAWTALLQPFTQNFGSSYSLVTKPGPTLMASDQVAMGVISTANIAQLRSTMKDDWNIVPMPVQDGTQTTGGGSYSLSITNSAKNKEGAWTFMSWFYSSKGMDVASADGITPATKAGIAGGAWTHPKDSTPADYVSTVKASVPKAILPNPIPDAVQPKVVPALQQAQQEVLLKGTSIQQAYTQAQDSLNAMLK